MNKNLIALCFSIILIIIVVGFSYAYFSAQVENVEEEATIKLTSGTLGITYDGGENITIANVYPQDNAIASKNITITGNNNTKILMEYELLLIVDDNTFSKGALKFTLESINTDNNGEIIPEIPTKTNIKTGHSTYLLGHGGFDLGTNKKHKYILNIYFPNDPNVNQNSEQGKIFKAHVKIHSKTPDLLVNLNDHVMDLLDDPTSGVNKEPGNDYRYEGAEAHNYLLFNDEVWRIIGVFDENTHGKDEKLVKIIREESIGQRAWDNNHTNNNWPSSYLYTYLNNDYFNDLETKYQNIIENVTWKLGGYDNILGTALDFYNAERNSTPSTNIDANIGLMYPSDYGFSVLKNACPRETGFNLYHALGCFNASWIFNSGDTQWTITANPNTQMVWFITHLGYVNHNWASTNNDVHPVVYLKSNTVILNGDGTIDNPFIIDM